MITIWATGAILTAGFLGWVLWEDRKVLWDEMRGLAILFLAGCVLLWPVFVVAVLMMLMEGDE